MSEYIVSARKYRPDSFGTLIGQDNIAQTLKNSILRGQLAHAYLFCGPRGVGKTSTARIFAKTINCSSPTPDMEPCGKCESCLSFAEGRSYCIHELDAASNNGVDDIKALMEQVRIPPQVGRYSVYIIDEVHMLSQAAFNAFLKTLEEPPAHAIFILATTEKHKILPTILSRCQTYDFNRITVDNIVRNLRDIATKEGITVDDESLHVIAHKADGAMRDALTIFDQTVAFCGTDIKYQDVLKNLNVLDYEHCFMLMEDFLKNDYAAALLKFDEILSKGFNALHFMAALSSHLRDLAVSKNAGLDALLDLPESLKKKYREQAARCPMQLLYDALSITTACEAGYRTSINPRLHIEFALMKLCFLTKKIQDAPARPAEIPERQAHARQEVHKEEMPQGDPEVKAPPVPDAAAGAPGGIRMYAPAGPEAAPGPMPDDGQAQTPPVQRRRQARAAAPASLSIKAMMSGKEENAPADTQETASSSEIPEDEVLRFKWKDLAAMYASKPRLSNTLSTSSLEISLQDGAKYLTFNVLNVAQKDWIESKLLHELEKSFRKLTGSDKVYLRVAVLPDTEVKQTIYMPSEQAKDLMSKNEEVKNLVKDFDLDVK